MKLSLEANLMLNWVCPVLSFPERFQLITAVATCTVGINVLEPGALNAEFQYFIPLFNRISCLCAQHPRGDDEASNWVFGGGEGGATQAPQGMTFQITLIFTFLFFTTRTAPTSKCENRSGSQIDDQVRTREVFTRRFSPQWKPSIRFSWRLTSPVLTARWFSSRTGLKIRVGCQPMGENRPTLALWYPSLDLISKSDINIFDIQHSFRISRCRILWWRYPTSQMFNLNIHQIWVLISGQISWYSEYIRPTLVRTCQTSSSFGNCCNKDG
jgi:hypothetical protein